MFEISKDGKTAIGDTNSFANICGFFFNSDLENPEAPSCNNGYNCKHPNCEVVEDGIGCCYSWGCPLGWEADAEDFESFGWNPNEQEEGEWMVTGSLEMIEKIKEIIK